MRIALGLLFVTCLWAAPAQLKLYPETVTLNSRESRQQLLAEAAVDGRGEDWTRTAAWSSSNASVVEVDAGGMLTPKGDGEAA